MAQKRRKLAMQEAHKREKPPPKPTGIELFWGRVLSWNPVSLEDEEHPPMSPIPNYFDSKKHYFSSFKRPILAEAKAILASSKGTWSRTTTVRLALLKPEEKLSWGGRMLHLTPTSTMTRDEFEYMRPGQVFLLKCSSNKSSSFNNPVLAAWANGLSKQSQGSNQRTHVVLLIHSSSIPSHETRFEATPLDSLLSLQRMFDACIRQSTPPFFNDMLMGKKSSHIRFDSDTNSNSEEEEGDDNDGEDVGRKRQEQETKDEIPCGVDTNKDVEVDEIDEIWNSMEASVRNNSSSTADDAVPKLLHSDVKNIQAVADEMEGNLNQSQLAALKQFTLGDDPRITLVQV
jgi:hypothetical protein